MYLDREELPSPRRIIAFLAVIGIAILCYDVWQVWSGTVDLNQHLPFLYPVAMAAFIAIVVRVDRATRRSPKDRQRILETLEQQSFTHPDNLPRGRFKDGSIG